MKVCSQNEILINMYIDGELSADDTDKLEQHMASCEGCRRFYEELSLISRAVSDVECPEVLHESIMSALAKERKSRKKPLIHFGRFARIAAAAAAVAIAVLAGFEAGMIPAFGADSAENASEPAAAFETKLADSVIMPETEAVDAAEDQKADMKAEMTYVISDTTLGWFRDDGKDHVMVICDDADGESAEMPADENNANSLFMNISEDITSEAHGYGYYLLAAGSLEELSSVFSEQAAEAEAGYTLMISVDADKEVCKDIKNSMSESGFEIYDVTDDGYFRCDPEAEEGLLIVCLDEE